jgi:hypothetical protein
MLPPLTRIWGWGEIKNRKCAPDARWRSARQVRHISETESGLRPFPSDRARVKYACLRKEGGE